MERASWSLLGFPGAGQEVEEAAAFARFLRRRRLRNEEKLGLHIALIPTAASPISLTDERTDAIRSLGMQAWSGGGSTSFALDGFMVFPGAHEVQVPTGMLVSQHGWVEYWRQNFQVDTNAIHPFWVEQPTRAVLTLGNLLLKYAAAPPAQWLIAVTITAASRVELRHSSTGMTGQCPNTVLELGIVVSATGDLSVALEQVMTGFVRAFGWTVYDADERQQRRAEQ